MIRRHLGTLLQNYREMFFEGLEENQQWLKASAWYESAYCPADYNVSRSSRCFAWVVGDILCDIKQHKLEGSSACQKADVHALIGKSVQAELLETLPAVQQVVASRWAATAVVQQTLDAYCAFPQDDKVKREPPFFVLPLVLSYLVFARQNRIWTCVSSPRLVHTNIHLLLLAKLRTLPILTRRCRQCCHLPWTDLQKQNARC